MKFSIRDLFLMTVIVALGVGWWLDRGRLQNEAAHFKREADNSAKEASYTMSKLATAVELLKNRAPAPKSPKN